jgi:hypothetical protein
MLCYSRFLLLILVVLGATIAASGRQSHAVPAGQPCGEGSGATCDKGLWCEPAAGGCGSPQGGVCVTVPKLCFARKKGKSFQPVCGCNNKTYSNDCFRRAYRVAKFHDGKC